MISSHVSVTTCEGGGRLEPGAEQTISQTSRMRPSMNSGGMTVVPTVRRRSFRMADIGGRATGKATTAAAAPAVAAAPSVDLMAVFVIV
ncbi:hypothetical protein A6302_01851 [Methylobrevis pamukkalensis]|uniref:Uncharacterized protein n=1 Tax=Methylobrevis pamukkalensis TaxID=1439726 RepID=A0A1E3H3E4_9HYPH|nr:hypothetical protein A6302_01851 [Methylobrevis pamukkalensis]